MKLVLCLDKDDIHTSKCGHNYVVETMGVTITFTPEAAQEFINDIQGIQAALAENPELEHCPNASDDQHCTHT
jgi:hypothetical protein